VYLLESSGYPNFTITRRYPGQIIFFTEQIIDLFNAIVKDLPELVVLYKKDPVSPNLVLIKGALLNTGKIDISPTMIEMPITMTLPSGYRWLTAKIISSSPNVKADLYQEDKQNIIIKSGLLRCNENIRLQALVEVSPLSSTEKGTKHESMSSRLEEAIRFSHRIANTRKIEKKEIRDATLHSAAGNLFQSLIFGILLTVSLVWFLFLRNTIRHDEYGIFLILLTIFIIIAFTFYLLLFWRYREYRQIKNLRQLLGIDT
jgi:hypothetical protein